MQGILRLVTWYKYRSHSKLWLFAGLLFTSLYFLQLLGHLTPIFSSYFWFNNAALEKKLDAAITKGDIFSPEGGSAYHLYHKLKQNGVENNTLARYRDRLLPLLTAPPQKMLADFIDPDVADLYGRCGA